MLLAIDVRNTHTVVGLLSGSKEHAKVVQQWRIRTESEITADERRRTTRTTAISADATAALARQRTALGTTCSESGLVSSCF